MINKKLVKGQKVYFIGENLPFNVMAVNDNFAVISREICKNEDNDLLEQAVEMEKYASLEDAYENYKEMPVYSLMDIKREIKGSSINFMDDTDYFSELDCENVLVDLENGMNEISRRSSCEYKIDLEQTFK